MSFMKAIEETLNEEYNVSITENGAVVYRTSGTNAVDFFFKVSSYRNMNEVAIKKDFNKVLVDNAITAARLLFYIRDIRGGLGERRLFRVCLKCFNPEVLIKFVPLIAEYGRYDDLWDLLGLYKEVDKCIFEYVKNTLESDMNNMKENESISLLSKWLPSSNASSAETKRLAAVITKGIGLTARQYRKMLSALRGYLRIVERDMSAKEWGNINYEAVPSRANLIYNDAFLRNDEERRREYLGKLEKGEAKINSSVLFPHDIVNKYRGKRNRDSALEAMWKGLPVTPEMDGVLVVRDGSWSMDWATLSGSNCRALDVATALAIYFSERCTGEFHDKFITFSANPKLIDLSDRNSLKAKIDRCNAEDDSSNTNIEKTFDLILDTAVKYNMSQEELPKTVLILSDMEFDGATSGRANEKLFTTISNKFKDAGYFMPRLAFWNLCGRTSSIPLKQNELGVALISGFSVNVAKMVMSNKLDPYDCLMDAIGVERYDPVEAAVKS